MVLQDYCVNEKDTIIEVVSAIMNNFSRCVIVLGDCKKVIGVFSEGDVLRSLLEGINIHTPLNRLLTPSFYYLGNRDMQQAYKLVKSYGITLLPIVDENFYLQDIITIFDVMEHLRYHE